MRKIKLFTSVAAAVICSTSFAQTTLIKNVVGYTPNNGQTTTLYGMKIEDDRIVQVFHSKEQVNQQSADIVIDGKGATLLPGLIDAHGHILSYGNSLMSADLMGSSSENDAITRTVKYANENPGITWVQGRGWNQELWDSKQLPTVKLLDKAFPDKPVFLKRVDGHAVWVNSKAMALAGINKNTVSPSGGEIIKDSNGNPTGVFIDNAIDLISAKIKPLTLEQQKTVMKKAMRNLAKYGLTSVHDAGIDSTNLKAFKEMAAAGELPIRVNAMLYLPSDNWEKTLSKGQFKTDDDMLTFNSVKIQADGALGSRGAAMIEDYSDKKGHRGLLLHSQQDLNTYVETAMKLGFQVNTHAIGDDANKLVLDTYEKYINATDSKALRHRVEHAQILRLKDIPRFAELGVIASMQATHATSDKNMAQDRVGADRILGAYAWRKLLKADAVIAAGSDFPVESPNPFYGLHASITRQDHKNQPLGGWLAKEKMTRTEALVSFTIDAAYSGHQEGLIGSLEVGKKADFILVDTDFIKADEKALWQTKVKATWVNGKKVY